VAARAAGPPAQVVGARRRAPPAPGLAPVRLARHLAPGPRRAAERWARGRRRRAERRRIAGSRRTAGGGTAGGTCRNLRMNTRRTHPWRGPQAGTRPAGRTRSAPLPMSARSANEEEVWSGARRQAGGPRVTRGEAHGATKGHGGAGTGGIVASSVAGGPHTRMAEATRAARKCASAPRP
jgi:hypothetical protein